MHRYTRVVKWIFLFDGLVCSYMGSREKSVNITNGQVTNITGGIFHFAGPGY